MHDYTHDSSPDEDLYSNYGQFGSNNFHSDYMKRQKRKREEEKKQAKEAIVKRKSILGPGLSGLDNMGNTCYMNSALQCLAHTPLLVSHILNSDFISQLRTNKITDLASEIEKRDGFSGDGSITIKRSELTQRMENTVSFQLYKVLNTMWKQNCIVVPRNFKRIIEKQNEQFMGYSQNDSHEVINLVLDKVSEETATSKTVKFKDKPKGVDELNKLRRECYSIINDPSKSPEEQEEAKKVYKKGIREDMKSYIILSSYIFWKKHVENYSIISNIFTGMFCTLTKCVECENITVKFSSFTNLSISIPEHGQVSIEKCLENFSMEERIDGENKIQCEECNKKTAAIRTMLIWELPEILIIHLKRFVVTQHGTRKVHTLVNFPLDDLSLSNCQIGWHDANTKYKLYAISEHRGGYGSGHYVSYCHNSVTMKWYEFNDDDVFFIPDEDVKKEIVTPHAYMMFYVKQNNSSESSDEDEEEESDDD
jgi:ubiquitin carboxyl-terminal hydrolase 8